MQRVIGYRDHDRLRRPLRRARQAQPDRSLVAFLPDKEQSAAHVALTGRQKLVLAITALSFALLVFSVIRWDSIMGFETTDPVTHETVQNDYWWNLGWWFAELTALFLIGAVVVGLVAGADVPVCSPAASR